MNLVLSHRNGSRVFWNLQSVTLGSLVGVPLVSIEMTYDDSNGVAHYTANDINALSFLGSLSENSSGTC